MTTQYCACCNKSEAKYTCAWVQAFPDGSTGAVIATYLLCADCAVKPDTGAQVKDLLECCGGPYGYQGYLAYTINFRPPGTGQG